MNKRIWISLMSVVACAALAYFIWPYAFTVVPIEQAEALAQSEAFDPVAYVDGVWASQIKPTISENAIDLAVILNNLTLTADGFVAKDELVPVTEKYGLITVGESHVYMVKLTGTITQVDTSKSIGIMDVQLEGYAGPIKVRVYIGSRIPSDETSIRDAVGFINFGDFKEQTEYGKVAAEINKRVNAEVLSPLNKETLVGKQIVCFGAFTIRTFNLINIDLEQVNVMPVVIEIQ